MLAVVKEPHIELSLGGEASQVEELVEFLREKYTIEVIHALDESDGDDTLDVRETDFWKQNATSGRILAGYRLKHGLTQAELSLRSGIHHVVISAYENDKRKISRKAAYQIAMALGENPEHFFQRLEVKK